MRDGSRDLLFNYDGIICIPDQQKRGVAIPSRASLLP